MAGRSGTPRTQRGLAGLSYFRSARFSRVHRSSDDCFARVRSTRTHRRRLRNPDDRMVKADPPKLSEIQVGHPAATRAAYRAADERRLRQSASTPGLPAVPQQHARPAAATSPVSRRAFETRTRTPDGGGGLIVAIRPPPPPAVRSLTSAKPLRSPPSQAALQQQQPAWCPAVRVRVRATSRARAKVRVTVTLPRTLILNQP